MSKEVMASESAPTQTSPIRSFTGHENQISMIVFSADGKKLVSASYDQSVRLWDIETGKELNSFKKHTDWVKTIAISNDGEIIVSGGLDHTARVYNSQTGQEICSFSDESIVQSVAISPNKQLLATGTEAGIARLYNLATNQQIFCLGEHMTAVLQLAFSPNGNFIVGATGKSIYVWDVQTGVSLVHFDSNKARVMQLRFLSDSKHIISGSEDGMIHIYDVEDKKEVKKFNGYSHWQQNIALSKDEKYLFGAYDSWTDDNKAKVTIRRWEMDTAKSQDQHLIAHITTIAGAAFSPDCQRIVTYSTDRNMFLWDLKF